MKFITFFHDNRQEIEQKEEQQRITLEKPKMENNFFHREKRIATRSQSKCGKVQQLPYLAHHSISEATIKKKNKRHQDFDQNWRVHGREDIGYYEDAAELQGCSVDSGNYARTLGFPGPFAEFISHLDPVETRERLNRSLPVSLWKHILAPIAKAIKPSEGEK